MVKFEWSWADHRRARGMAEKRALKRIAKRDDKAAAPAKTPPAPPLTPKSSVAAVIDQLKQADRDRRAALAAQQEQMQTCVLCGKKRLRPCAELGCPVL